MSVSPDTTDTPTTFRDTSTPFFDSSTSFSDVTNQSENGTTSVFDTYGYFIHPHWKQYGTVPDMYHYMVGVYITIVGITGITGNSIVIWIFSTTRSLKTPSNMLIINLALSDLVFSLVNGFPLLTISAFNRKWMWGDAACQFYGFIGGLFGLMSIITLAAISIDRYYHIAEPMKAAQYMTRKKSLIMIVIVWAWSLVWAVPPIFGWGAYVPEGFQTSCTFDYITKGDSMTAYFIGLFVGGFFLPLFLIMLSYILIWRALRKHDREMIKMAKKMKVADIRANQEKTKAEVRIAKIAMMIVMLFVLSWSPYAVICIIAQFGPLEWINPYVSELPVMFAKAAAMHNPIVYAFSHPKFRQALHKRVPWLMCCCDVKMPPTSSASQSVGRGSRISRQVSNDSFYVGGNDNSDVSSCVSQLEDYGQSIQMTNAVSETSFTKNTRTQNPPMDTESGKIVRDLIQALVDVSTSRHAQSQNIPPQNNQVPINIPEGVNVVIDGKEISIKEYMSKLMKAESIPKVENDLSKKNDIPPKKEFEGTDEKTTKKSNDAKETNKESLGGNVKGDGDTEHDSNNEKTEACYTNPSYQHENEKQISPENLEEGHV